MAIMMNSLREKIRRKDLYIVAAIGLLIIALFTTGTGTITVGGEPITDYRNMIPILMTTINTVSGVLAIILSLRTIPNEYQRKTSHLIWIRGISQTKYHGELVMTNIIISLFSAAIMYGGILVFTIVKGEYQSIARMLPAFCILGISITITSLVTSILSIKLPGMIAGVIAVFCYTVGSLHSVLDVMRSMVTGFVSVFIRIVLSIVPDLHEIQSQAGNMLKGSDIDIHSIIKGLFTIYLLTLLLTILKRKEA